MKIKDRHKMAIVVGLFLLFIGLGIMLAIKPIPVIKVSFFIVSVLYGGIFCMVVINEVKKDIMKIKKMKASNK